MHYLFIFSIFTPILFIRYIYKYIKPKFKK